MSFEPSAVKALLRCINIAYRDIPPNDVLYRTEVAKRMLEVFNEELEVTIEDAVTELERGGEWVYPGIDERRAGFLAAQL